MPTIGAERQILLSLVSFLKTELTNSGWGNVTFVSFYPDNEAKIVMSGTGASDEIVIPAISIQPSVVFEGNLLGLGETSREHNSGYSILLYGKSIGQEMGLRQFIADRLYNGNINMLDYSASGWPGTGSETILGPIYIQRITHSPAYAPSHANEAARYAGVVNFSTLTYI